jgi:hypothetical protein
MQTNRYSRWRLILGQESEQGLRQLRDRETGQPCPGAMPRAIM